MCFTSDNQMNRADAYCLQFSFPSFLKHTSSSSSSSVECWPNTRLDWNPGSSGGRTTSSDSKCLSARVSHSAAALCVCVSDSRTATYCVVLVFAFEKAATVSLVVVQQWVWVCVCVSVCMCACGCGVLANPAPTWPNYFLFYLNSSFFFFSCFLQPKAGFYHKAGQSNLHRLWWLSLLSVRWHFEEKLQEKMSSYLLVSNHTVAHRYWNVYK